MATRRTNSSTIKSLDPRVLNTISALVDGRGIAAFDDLVHRTDITQRRLEQIFGAQTGTTMREFWTVGRLHMAAELLTKLGCSVKGAQVDAGFCDASDFTHLFKKHFSMTPSEYRAAHRQAATSIAATESSSCPDGKVCSWKRVVARMPLAPADPISQGASARHD